MRTVDEVMTRDVVTVHPDTPFKQIAQLLLDRGVHAVPVVDEEGDLLGVVSEADLTCHEEAQPTLARLLTGGRTARSHARKARARTARELMSAPARTVAPETDVVSALRLMATAHVGRLPVAHGRRLRGIVTRTDLLRIFTRSDEELQVEVDQAIRAALGPEAADVRTTVADGVAHLRGQVERASTARAAEHAARRVAGLVDVQDDLVAEIDDLEVVSGYVGA